jgi:PBP1b-binding outer membrane lipoprotein LpoB
MNALKPIALIALVAVALAGCSEKKAENNTPTKPDSTKMEPQTDQSVPPAEKPKP